MPTYLPLVLFDLLAKRAEPGLPGISRPDDWLAASMVDFTSLLQVFLWLGSDCESLHKEPESPHEEQWFFKS